MTVDHYFYGKSWLCFLTFPQLCYGCLSMYKNRKSLFCENYKVLFKTNKNNIKKDQKREWRWTDGEVINWRLITVVLVTD